MAVLTDRPAPLLGAKAARALEGDWAALLLRRR